MVTSTKGSLVAQKHKETSGLGGATLKHSVQAPGPGWDTRDTNRARRVDTHNSSGPEASGNPPTSFMAGVLPESAHGPENGRLTLATINVRGGLEKDLEEVADLMSAENIDVVCVSNSGYRNTVVSGVLAEKALGLGLAVFCNGGPESRAGNTAIVLRAGLRSAVGEILRDESGRLLGLWMELRLRILRAGW